MAVFSVSVGVTSHLNQWFPFCVAKGMMWKNQPDGIQACERFLALALVLSCVPERLWIFMKRRMPWTLWQKTEFTTLLQSHQKMPGTTGSFVRFVHSVQVWTHLLMGEFEKHNQFLFAGEKGGFVPECHFVLPGMHRTYFGDLMLQLSKLWFSQSQDCQLLMWLWACWIQGLLQQTHKP